MFLGLITWALISYIRTKLFNSNILLLFGYLAKFVFIISYLITIWAGYRVSFYTMRKDTLNGKPIKCLRYVIDIYEGAKIWADNQSDVIQKSLNVWHSDMMRKLYDKNGAVTEYYCNEIGVPFVKISTSALIYLFFLLLSLNRRDNKNKDIIT